jgi:hypothetical protein
MGSEAQTIDQVYTERAQLVAFLTTVYPAHISPDPEGSDWDYVFVDTPTGQMSWQFSPADQHFVKGLASYSETWDGHTTEEKYERLDRLVDHRVAHEKWETR